MTDSTPILILVHCGAPESKRKENRCGLNRQAEPRAGIRTDKESAADSYPCRYIRSALAAAVYTVHCRRRRCEHKHGKKAFSDLESYGAIYTVPGKGSFVSEKAFKNDSVHDTAVSEVSDAISAARAKGLKKQEIIDILNEIYTQEEEL